MDKATGATPARDGTAELDRLAKSGVVSVRLARRARIVLMAMRGMDDVAIAQTLRVGRAQVARWRKRFAAGGVAAIAADLPRSGRKPKVDADRILELTRQPAPDGSRVTSRKIAEVCGVSDSTVVRVWDRSGLSRRHSTSHSDASDRAAACPLACVLGMLLGSRERVLAICAVGGLPAHPPGVDAAYAARARRGCGSGSEDADGPAEPASDPIIIANPISAGEAFDATDLAWLDFLHRIRKLRPIDRTVTLICDARLTISRPRVRAWLADHPEFAVEVAPSGLAWRGRVDRMLRRAQDGGGDDLEASGFRDLMATLVGHFAASKCGHVPFVWTRSALRPTADACWRGGTVAMPLRGNETAPQGLAAISARHPGAGRTRHASVEA